MAHISQNASIPPHSRPPERKGALLFPSDLEINSLKSDNYRLAPSNEPNYLRTDNPSLRQRWQHLTVEWSAWNSRLNVQTIQWWRVCCSGYISGGRGIIIAEGSAGDIILGGRVCATAVALGTISGRGGFSKKIYFIRSYFVDVMKMLTRILRYYFPRWTIIFIW